MGGGRRQSWAIASAVWGFCVRGPAPAYVALPARPPAAACAGLATAAAHRACPRRGQPVHHNIAPTMTPAAAGALGLAIVLDPFAARSFVEPGQAPAGRAFIQFDKQDFEVRVNSWYVQQLAVVLDPLQPGYAPFCKHLFVPNFVPGLQDTVLPITSGNSGLLQSAYIARTEKELPVLTRWFRKADVATFITEAKFLDIILYSREQIRKENEATGENSDSDAPWGIVSVKPQGLDKELPMEPITMMRNALGVEEGGSGVRMDREAYASSVKFWNEHARVQ